MSALRLGYRLRSRRTSHEGYRDQRRRTVTLYELERRGAVRRAEPGRPVVSGARIAEISRIAKTVKTGLNVEQPTEVRVRIRGRVDRAAVDAIDAGDDRRSDAGPAHHHPARRQDVALEVDSRRVDRDAGVGIGDRGDVVHHLGRASGVVLPGRLGGQLAATADRVDPGRLGPAAEGARGGQRGAADGNDVLGRRRELRALAKADVAGARDQHDVFAVVVVRLVVRVTGELVAAVAVADHVGAEVRSHLHRSRDVLEQGAIGLDEQQLAVAADRADHVEIDRGLLHPADVLGRKGAGLAELVHLADAAVRGRARPP